jgi:hypothetical protein
MTWKDKDVVTTTYGSIKLAQAQAYDAGIMSERKAILKFVHDAIDKNANALVHFALNDLLDKINETSN